ncbi:NB-ARC domain-containing protein [Streptomyces rubiginosohelvolus]|uniref:NB-ARC domain-containing protein n=1 Tax=Streptomyces rubiginosohelvolus TaxID=67362 RepID=UPI0033B6B9E3
MHAITPAELTDFLVRALGSSPPAAVGGAPGPGPDSAVAGDASAGAPSGPPGHLARIAAESAPARAVARAWRGAVASPGDPAAHRVLAEELLAEAAQRPGLRDALAEAVGAGAAQAGVSVNEIGGSARLYGPTVQARSVSGGIHFHAAGDAPGPHRAPPRQLLPAAAHFTGREGDLAVLDRMLSAKSDRAHLLVVISGPAGVGKTALATRWLHSVQEDFPDGQMYADLRGHADTGPAAPGEVLGPFLRALGVASVPAEPMEQAALWRSVTAGLRVAVMLDNALTAAQVRPLLPGGAHSLVVVTGRRRLTGLSTEGAEFHPLGLLDAQAGVDLLRQGIGHRRVADEPQASREVVALCAGLPLAVCLIAARLAARPRQRVRALADALARDAGPQAVLNLVVEGEMAVRNALDASCAGLGPEAARLYRRLGLLPVRTFDADTAAVAAEEEPERAEALLDELIEANLVEEVGSDSCRLHDLVRAHAAERAAAAEPARTRNDTVRRVAEWYLWAATEAEKRLTPQQFTLDRTYLHGPPGPPAPFLSDTGALAWLDRQRLNLMAVIHHAVDRGWDDLCWQLVDAAWPLFLRLRHYDLWIEAHGIGLAAARRAGRPAAVRQMLNSGAIGLSAAGRTGEAVAWYEASARAAREAGDFRDEGQALLGLGACSREAGRLEEADIFLHRAIEVWEGCGYARGGALARIVLGELALAEPGPAGPHRAVELFTHARDTMAAVPDVHDAARAQAFLGRASVRAGDYALGTARLTEALAAFDASGAAHWQARSLEMLAESAAEHGEGAVSRDYYERALALYGSTSPDDAVRVTDRLVGPRSSTPPAGPAAPGP